jgi:hypothetical protein
MIFGAHMTILVTIEVNIRVLIRSYRSPSLWLLFSLEWFRVAINHQSHIMALLQEKIATTTFFVK